jgi:hypothetical protein
MSEITERLKIAVADRYRIERVGLNWIDDVRARL